MASSSGPATLSTPTSAQPVGARTSSDAVARSSVSSQCALDLEAIHLEPSTSLRASSPLQTSSPGPDDQPLGSPQALQPERPQLDAELRLPRILLARGKVADALQLVEGLQAQLHDHPDVLCLKGQCHSGAGRNAEAFACLSAALASDFCHVDALVALGSLYKACGLLEEAITSLEQAYSLRPQDQAISLNYAILLTDHGTKLKLAERIAEGMRQYERAAAVHPQYAPAFYNIGVVHSERRDFRAAQAAYQRAITAAAPLPYAEAQCNLGVIHKNEGRLEEAVACYEAALAAAPNFAIVQSNLAISLTELGTRVKVAGDLAGGFRLYERALSCNPRYPDALYNLGVACGETGRTDRAIFLYELAVHFNPSCAEAWNNLGVLQREQGNIERAVQCYNAALHVRPNFPQGLNNLAVVYTAQGRAREALQMLHAAIAAAPGYAEAYNNLGVLQRDVGAIREAIQSYQRCLELAPASRNAAQNRLLALNYITGGEDSAVAAAHAQWGAAFQATVTQLAPVPRPPPGSDARDRPLVVGYVSPDFFTHSVSYFADAPLSHHNPSRVRHIVYNCVPKADAKTAALRGRVAAAGGTWRDVAALGEPDLAACMRVDACDLVVELTGHTANNRLGALAARPAPVQVTYCGYPNTTGLPAIDYRLTDAIADPPSTRQTFTEALVRLPGCFLCYTPAADAPPVAPAPCIGAGFVTFGSFNNLAKITPAVVRCWSRILAAVPSARLVLKNKPFACASASAHFLAQLVKEGVAASRVDALPLVAGNAEHLGLYALMDVSLDPFPYAGTTTTCESLYMGVPVITLAGQCHAHNVGVSLLDTMGLREEGWVAHSEDEYVACAVAVASDLQELASVRAGLRARMLASRLCDAPRFVAGLEAAYRDMWHCWLDAEDTASS